MQKNLISNEKWIRLENELADELLSSNEEQRTYKYSEVYENLYSQYPEEKRQEMFTGYRMEARMKMKTIKKIVGTDKTILEIGCGFGNLASMLAEAGNRVTGIDINGIHIKEAIERFGNIDNLDFQKTKGVKLDFPDNSFDFVTSTSVFEHLHPDDVDSHMSEVRRVLRNSGKYFFSALTPYVRGDQSIYSQDPEQREKHGFHINERTWAELESILERNGFTGKTDILPYRIVKRIPFFLFFVPLKVKALLEKSISINDVTIKVFRLGWVTIVAKKCR